MAPDTHALERPGEAQQRPIAAILFALARSVRVTCESRRVYAALSEKTREPYGTSWASMMSEKMVPSRSTCRCRIEKVPLPLPLILISG
jgi:hypothetical protein